LCFFPSYALLAKMSQRWRTTGALTAIAATKGGRVFSEETNTAKREDFSKMLADFRAASRTPKGALLFAVCRGKASEGLDFSDEAARGVVIVGVPYPNTRDLRVTLKREHEEMAVSRGAGNAWYVAQGHRAANQAIGRVVRHRWDFGAVFLLDARYGRPDVSSQLSRWLRTSLVHVPTIETVPPLLASFFEAAQRHVIENRPSKTASPASPAPQPQPQPSTATDDDTPAAQLLLSRKRSI
jgi:Fanconi anemia group J protein